MPKTQQEKRSEAADREDAYGVLSLEDKLLRAYERGHYDTREAKRLREAQRA